MYACGCVGVPMGRPSRPSALCAALLPAELVKTDPAAIEAALVARYTERTGKTCTRRKSCVCALTKRPTPSDPAGRQEALSTFLWRLDYLGGYERGTDLQLGHPGRTDAQQHLRRFSDKPRLMTLRHIIQRQRRGLDKEGSQLGFHQGLVDRRQRRFQALHFLAVALLVQH